MDKKSKTKKTLKQTTKASKKKTIIPKNTTKYTNKKGGNNISKNLLENKNINFKISSSK